MKDDNEKLKVLFKLLCMWKVEHQNKDFAGTEKLFRQLQKTFKGENVPEFPNPSSEERVENVDENVEEKEVAEEIVDDSDDPQGSPQVTQSVLNQVAAWNSIAPVSLTADHNEY